MFAEIFKVLCYLSPVFVICGYPCIKNRPPIIFIDFDCLNSKFNFDLESTILKTYSFLKKEIQYIVWLHMWEKSLLKLSWFFKDKGG